MTPQETFVTRLRRHRQRNRLSLDDLAADTRVKREHLEALENNDLSAWPRGLYARAWIRAYAGAVGLDPIDTVDEFCRLFSAGDRRGQSTVEEIAAIVASASAFDDGFDPTRERRADAKAARAARPPSWPGTVADAARTSARQAGEVVSDVTRSLSRTLKPRGAGTRQP
jgi:transcriptional regulator with XRE-family HTH domain